MGKRRQRRRGRDCTVCTMKASIAGCAAANAFFVAKYELRFEECNGPFIGGTKTKFFGGGCEEPGLFDHCQSQSDNGDVRNWNRTKSGDSLNVDNFGPDIFNGIIKVPWF